MTWKKTDDHDLRVGNVGVSFDLQFTERPYAKRDERDSQQHRYEPLVKSKPHDVTDHVMLLANAFSRSAPSMTISSLAFTPFTTGKSLPIGLPNVTST